ncbi:MAG: DUF3656 domain-containing U32 family peptidase [Anaerovoracaceae bacterium]|jgi:putative protease
MEHKCELLAPAGGMKQLKAAVENGADAVYLGGRLFNARMNADNFGYREMREAIAYAHLRGVKIHVTLNTLLTDEELPQALEYAAELYRQGADALIVQDLGLARLIRRYLPGLPLHLSTQGTVYNASGVRAAAALGFSRAVLARELSLQEIAEITAEKACEIEVFCHGALCICYSGQCQLSRAIGGRSGNRGQCAQPCRLPYRNEKGEAGYWLSPKDLCTIDYLPQLVDAGVDSLKIEGRMKSAEYVAVVTSIYRKYLDMCYQKGAYHVSRRDRETLAQVFNRGGFTSGYLAGDPGADLLSGELPKHQGIYVGKVIAPRGRGLVDIETDRGIVQGDGVEIHARRMTGNVITFVQQLGKGRQRIGDIRGRVAPGDKVYRITDSVLMRAARSTFEGDGQRKSIVDMTFIMKTDTAPLLRLICGDQRAEVSGSRLPQQARTRALDEELVRRQLQKTGGTAFKAGKIKTVLDGGLSLPASELNHLRRAGLKALESEMLRERRTGRIPHIECGPLHFECGTPEGILRLPPVTRGELDRKIADRLKAGKDIPGEILVENLGWIRELRQAGAAVYGGAGLNVYNSEAKRAVESLCAVCTEPSREAMAEADLLMVTEHPVKAKRLTDRMGQEYEVHRGRYGDQTYIIKAGTRVPEALKEASKKPSEKS